MNRTPFIVGHRGASREAPENTLAAFRLAWKEGADGIEADFRLTKDERIVCLHDATTGRTADRDIAVADATLAELRCLDAGIWKGSRWRGERISTLAEVLEMSPPGKSLFLEIKSGPEILPALAHELAASGKTAECATVLSFSAPLVALLKQRMPGVKTCWLTDYRRDRRSGAVHPGHAEILAILAEIGADGLASRAHESLDAEFVVALRRAGLALHVWTVDTVAKARHYVQLGVDSIMTNRPGWLKTGLADHHGPS